MAVDETILTTLNGVEGTDDDTTGMLALATDKHEGRLFTQAEYAVILIMWPVVDIARHATNFALVAFFQIDDQVCVV
jgi:hypothetical protein